MVDQPFPQREEERSPPPPSPRHHRAAGSLGFHESDITVGDGSVFRVYHYGDLPGHDEGEGGTQRPVLLFLHGAGQTALSFALMGEELMRLATVGGAGVIGGPNGKSHAAPLILCPDLPFHGQTHSLPDDKDFSVRRLVADVLTCLEACLAGGADTGGEGRRRYNLTLIGHSLGAALVIRLGSEPELAALGDLKGICVVEMVEAAALQHLDGMRRCVQESIPHSFASPEAAVRWSLKAGFLRHEASAEISIPSQLRPVLRADGGGTEHVWILRLLDTEAYWRGWFEGTSEAFLALPAAKLSVLASYATLDCDKALTAAQMQGCFHQEFIQGAGHNLHEDCPEAFARVLFRFLVRNKILCLPDLPLLRVEGIGSSSGGPGSRAISPCPSTSPRRPHHSRSAPPSPSPSLSPTPPPVSPR